MSTFSQSQPSECSDWRDCTAQFKSQCLLVGFPLVGITDVLSPPRYAQFESWLERGFAGSMSYLSNRKEAYRNATNILDGCQRIVMLGIPYSKSIDELEASEANHGKVARYASGTIDYHDLIRDRLKLLRRWLEIRYPNGAFRGIVDTAPLLEREFASLAGIGWIGKNTLLLTRTHGSYFFLAALLTDLPLVADTPFESDHCGTCRACLDACPTQAFPEAHILDASRCISFLTIEHRGTIDPELQSQVGEWLFGCDVCQEVCPWNRRPTPEIDSMLKARSEHHRLSLASLLTMSPEAFRIRFRHTPLSRTRWEGMVRNAAMVAGNTQRADLRGLLQLLAEATESDSIRSAAQEAIKKIDQRSEP